MSIYKQLTPPANTPSTDITSGIPDLSEYYSDDEERVLAEAKINNEKTSTKPLKSQH
jgi:hypothetical protein